MSVQNEQTQKPIQDHGLDRRRLLLGGTTLAAASALSSGAPVQIAQAQQPAPTQPPGRLPNVLLIMADDVGWFDVGAYHRGMMGARTPNIDRIAAEGVMLTDAYAQASCTAGRAAFITGSDPDADGLDHGRAAGCAAGDPSPRTRRWPICSSPRAT